MPGYGWLKAITYILVLPSLSAYFSMNFTGSSTYTSLSGVDKEMRIGLPVMIIAAAAGIILTLVNDFIRVFGERTVCHEIFEERCDPSAR